MAINDYPTDEELEQLKDFDVIKNPEGFLELLESLWNTEYGSFELTGKKSRTLKLVTGGWSGNEDILENLPMIFSMQYWYQSKRGGLHIYKIRTTNK